MDALPPSPLPPVQSFLLDCHARFGRDDRGALADYIPELSRADPHHFGLCVATLDGHVHEAGDARVPFTIQSISKAYVFALALELCGAEAVHRTIGVEPSGDAFNAIRLRQDKRPFNPMVNAGAIACSGLLYAFDPDGAFERIRDFLGRCAGRELDVDEAVFASEAATGDRNRAIAWLLRSNGLLEGDVEAVLAVYFRQCALRVTARDLAIIGATFANVGINPVTGEAVCSPQTVARTLSVMTSAGMYDFAGEWIYRVGLPAKSGVGGGIVASLPGQLGLGTFSPRLDPVGNSVRGLHVCEALSERFGLHMLARSEDVRTAVSADYDTDRVCSGRHRQVRERQILQECAGSVRILELSGALGFLTADYVSRLLLGDRSPRRFAILDLTRVSTTTRAARQILGDTLTALDEAGTVPVLADDAPGASTWASPRLRRFPTLDEALEWTEDQLVADGGACLDVAEVRDLGDQALLAGLDVEQLQILETHLLPRELHAGERVIVHGDEATALYLLTRGTVSVRLPDGTRLATLIPGEAFGEMGLIERHRSADVVADCGASCLELPLGRFRELQATHPAIAERMVYNLAVALAGRLDQANARLQALRG